ncbi:hypothetical protein [Streptomyces sp. NPDC088258]|uniref:MmyB family transcriptional regulator n=1 Tax=Streptomyces sp. NPDC088258 TaxID=3365849 RepID=UPI0038113BA7
MRPEHRPPRVRLHHTPGTARRRRCRTAHPRRGSGTRTALSRYPGDDYLKSLFTELTTTSATIRAHWQRGEISAWRSAEKHMRHPTRGWLGFDEILHEPTRVSAGGWW